jgi:hypothetical protein
VSDLFTGGDGEYRDVLRLLGWCCIPVPTASGMTRYHWEDPDGKRHTEDEAFEFVRERERAAGGDHDTQL